MKIFLPLLVLCMSHIGSANAEKLYFGVGAFFQNMGKVTASPSGSTSLTGGMYVPTISVAGKFDLFSGMGLMPSVLYTPIAKSGGDSIKKRILFFNLPAVFTLNPELDFKSGLGLMFYSVGADGGTVSLNNGTSTATFYKPGKTKTAQTVTLDIGLGVKLPMALRLDFDILLNNALSKRRAFNGLVQISKGFL